jgi:hypothetical protein
MTKDHSKSSLLEGRNIAPLEEVEIKRASNTFLGLDSTINARYEAASRTRFLVNTDEHNEEYGEIVFSDDIYPGANIVNPNSALTLPGAAAHEIAHFYRWQDKTELSLGYLEHIDEAMTSLEAVLRFHQKLQPTDIQGLISDSLHRLRLFIQQHREGVSQEPETTNEPQVGAD